MKLQLIIWEVMEAIHWNWFIAWWVCRNIYESWDDLTIEDVKDIDIFCYKKESFEILKTILIKKFSDWLLWSWEDKEMVYEIKYKWIVLQLIKPRKEKYLLSYWNEEGVVETFDFNACRFYIPWFDSLEYLLKYKKKDYNNWEEFPEIEYVWWEESNDSEAVDEKILLVEHIVCPISSLRRAMKYAWYWYYLPAWQLMKLLNCIQDRKMDLKALQIAADEEWTSFYEMMMKFD